MNRKKKAPTVYDIAAEAHVSVATVSRVFSNSNYPVSPGTRDQILKVAERLGYVYRRAATPKAVQKKLVYVLVPDLENPFYMELVSGMEASLRSFGLDMVLISTNNSLQQEKREVEALMDAKSAVIISPATTENRHLNRLLEAGCEMVVIERFLSSACSSIQFNNYEGGRMAAQYLIKRGMRRIAYLSPALTRCTRNDLYQGFLQAMKENGIPVEQELICIADSPDEATGTNACQIGTQLCETLLAQAKEMPEAICCENDLIAIGVIGCLAQKGIRVPDEISVIGLDNISLGALIYPQLTTVDQCTKEMGSLAAELIHGNLMKPDRKRVQLLLEPRLVVRQSVR